MRRRAQPKGMSVNISAAARIPAEGGSARFSVVFPNDPAVVDYHIEAIGYGRKIVD